MYSRVDRELNFNWGNIGEDCYLIQAPAEIQLDKLQQDFAANPKLKRIKVTSLDYSNIDENSAQTLADFIQQNPNLIAIKLSGVNIAAEPFQKICAAVTMSETLQSFSIVKCGRTSPSFTDEHHKAMKDLLANCSLLEFSFIGSITTYADDFLNIFNGLRMNTSLNYIDFSENGELNDDCAAELAKIALRHPELQGIELRNNALSGYAIAEFIEPAEKNVNLTDIDLDSEYDISPEYEPEYSINVEEVRKRTRVNSDSSTYQKYSYNEVAKTFVLCMRNNLSYPIELVQLILSNIKLQIPAQSYSERCCAYTGFNIRNMNIKKLAAKWRDKYTDHLTLSPFEVSNELARFARIVGARRIIPYDSLPQLKRILNFDFTNNKPSVDTLRSAMKLSLYLVATHVEKNNKNYYLQLARKFERMINQRENPEHYREKVVGKKSEYGSSSFSQNKRQCF